MTRLEQLQATELHILRQASEQTDHGDHVVLRSETHATWYQGNMIELRRPDDRPLAAWIDVFRHHFDPAIYGHVTLYVRDPASCPMLMRDLDDAEGWHVQHITYMLASDTDRAPPMPEGLEVRAVETEEDWNDLASFTLEESRSEPWFTTDEDSRSHFAVRRGIGEKAGIQWLRLMRPGSREMLSRLGIFDHAGISRLQSVGTAAPHRRRGYAGALLGHAIRLAVNERRTAGLGLAVETGTSAHRLYDSVGFQPVGTECWAMLYPKH